MFPRPPIKHCKSCGNAVSLRLPDDGDSRQRAVCTVCALVHYENPLNVVGTIPVWHAHGDPSSTGQVLLCKRSIEPRKGFWTLPAGFMELNETSAQGAARETDEEAGAQFELQGLYSLINVPRVGQVHFFYRAKLLSDEFNPGFETLEARLFHEVDIPWEQIAFRTVRETLERYFAEARSGQFGLHHFDIV